MNFQRAFLVNTNTNSSRLDKQMKMSDEKEMKMSLIWLLSMSSYKTNQNDYTIKYFDC